MRITLLLVLVCLLSPSFGGDFENSAFNVVTELQNSLIREGKQREENFLASPVGLAVLLGQVRIFANPQLREVINTLLAWEKGNSVHKDFATVLEQLLPSPKASEVFEYVNSNALFKDSKVNISETASGLLKDHYDSEVISLNFSDSSRAQQQINSWVKQQTRNLIEQLPLSRNPQLVFANVQYFRASWFEPFDVVSTANGPFSVTAQKIITVPYMRNAEDLWFAEDTYYLKCKVFSKPYETVRNQQLPNNSRVLMHVILPDDGNVDDLVGRMTALNFDQMLENGGIARVTYQIPRVSVRSKFSFKDFLAKWYASDFGTSTPLSFAVRGFNSDRNADTERLRIDDITQETVLRVDEKGTEAASVTGGTIETSASDRVVKVDRPYVLLVREETTKLILFWATIRNPLLN